MSSYLLDTNALLFFLTAPQRLSKTAIELICDPSNVCHISMASFWEIAIKQGIGKLHFPKAKSPDFLNQVRDAGFSPIQIEWPIMLAASQLPPHHRDPFDRIIIAESMMREIPILSTDQQFEAYGVTRIE